MRTYIPENSRKIESDRTRALRELNDEIEKTERNRLSYARLIQKYKREGNTEKATELSYLQLESIVTLRKLRSRRDKFPGTNLKSQSL